MLLIRVAARRWRRGPARGLGLVSRFAWVLRLLLVIGAVQLSGVVHHVMDAVHLFQGVAQHEVDPCDDGDDCPPGCPTCHCMHGAFTVPQPLAPPTLLLWESPLVGAPPYDSSGPPHGRKLAVYRPPRRPSQLPNALGLRRRDPIAASARFIGVWGRVMRP